MKTILELSILSTFQKNKGRKISFIVAVTFTKSHLSVLMLNLMQIFQMKWLSIFNFFSTEVTFSYLDVSIIGIIADLINTKLFKVANIELIVA